MDEKIKAFLDEARKTWTMKTVDFQPGDKRKETKENDQRRT